jgi:hypothetical protein
MFGRYKAPWLVLQMVGWLILILISACNGKLNSPTPSPAPTSIIFGTEIIPPTGGDNPANPQPADNFTIRGTYEMVRDSASQDNGSFIKSQQHLMSVFTLKAGPAGRLDGIAKNIWVDSFQESSLGCKLSWTTGNIAWQAVLSGQYQKNADGSLQVSFSADPAESPGYTVSHDCKTQKKEYAQWPGEDGKLVNGVFDSKLEFPSAVGKTSITIHMQLAPNN